MSANASSVWITSMSEIGSTLPATCTTFSSLKQRTTLAMAAVSRMLARNWLPIPSPVQARVGHLDHAHVGLDGAERVVLRGDAGLGERVEEGRLAHVGQADDAALQ